MTDETTVENGPIRSECMTIASALQVLVDRRAEDQIVITNQGSAREWPKLCNHPLDFHYIPSAMGAAISLGLGLALAQPRRHVLVISGDGGLLMNLGCLVTVIGSGAANLSIVLIDNGVYEVTGGQKTPAREGETDFAGFARAAGFPNVSHFWNAEDWQRRASGVLDLPGPRFVWLQVQPVSEDYRLDPPCPMSEQLDRFQKTLFPEKGSDPFLRT